jgi:hypothetical protein
LELKADGNLGKVEISNGNGVIGRFNSAVGGTATAWLKLSGGSDGTARFAADSDTLTNVPLTVFAKGNSPVFIGNSFGSAAEFITSSGAGNNYFLFTAPNGSPPIISNATAGGGIIVKEQRVFTHQALGTSTLPLSDVGQHYHNGGASGVSTYNLPAAANGLNYCFIVKVAQQIVVKAAAGDKIAIAGSNSAAGGQISANAPFASICIEAHEAGQWFAISTPDKTQWTVL